MASSGCDTRPARPARQPAPAGKHILEFEFDDIREDTPKGPYVLDLKDGEKLFLNFETVMNTEEDTVIASKGEANYEAQDFLGFKMGETVDQVLPPADREVVTPGFRDREGQRRSSGRPRSTHGKRSSSRAA